MLLVTGTSIDSLEGDSRANNLPYVSAGIALQVPVTLKRRTR